MGVFVVHPPPPLVDRVVFIAFGKNSWTDMVEE